MTQSFTPQDVQQAATILTTSSWSFDYCHPEQVNHTVMAQHIAEIETALTQMSDEDVIDMINDELKSPFNCNSEVVADLIEEGIEPALAIARTVASDIGHRLAQDLTHESITFTI